MLLWQKMYVKRHQHQFDIVLNNWTFWRHHWDEFCIKTLIWHHRKSNWLRYWSQLSTLCLFTLLRGPAIDLQKMPILAKMIIFSFDLGVQNCCISVTENPLAIHWVTVWCGFWTRGIFGPFLFENERILRKLKEFLFTKIEEQGIDNDLVSTGRRYMPHSRSYTRCFVFEDRIIQRRADIHLGAAIWYRWTIIFGVLSKISVMPTSHRQLMLFRKIFVKLLVKYSCTQSMCLKIGLIV